MSIARRAIIKKPLFSAPPKHFPETEISERLCKNSCNSQLECRSKSTPINPKRPVQSVRLGAFRDDFDEQAELQRMVMESPESFRLLTFSQAAPLWLKEHSRYIKPRTIRDYRQYIAALEKIFADKPLHAIHVGAIREYQDWRAQTAGNSRINMECSTLQQILKDAGLWAGIAELYRPMPISQRGSGRSISKEDEDAFLVIAFSRPRWKLAAHCVRIMIRGGFGPGELFRVRRRDIDLRDGTITICEGAKNEDRERTVPLSGTALESLTWIVERFESLGGRGRADAYILPHCSSRRNGPRDFYRHQRGIRRAFDGMKMEAVKKIGPHMAEFRLYDCRVTAVTKVLRSGKVSIHTAKRLFGHVSEAMQKRYYKPDIDDLREATRVLEEPA